MGLINMGSEAYNAVPMTELTNHYEVSGHEVVTYHCKAVVPRRPLWVGCYKQSIGT